MATLAHKEFKSPDEIRSFEKGRLELVNMGQGLIGRLILEPGWRWSEHFKSIEKAEWLEEPHFQYHVSGRLHILMADGTEIEAGPGDITEMPMGQDAWVVGNEPVVLIDWWGVGEHPMGEGTCREFLNLDARGHLPA